MRGRAALWIGSALGAIGIAVVLLHRGHPPGGLPIGESLVVPNRLTLTKGDVYVGQEYIAMIASIRNRTTQIVTVQSVEPVDVTGLDSTVDVPTIELGPRPTDTEASTPVPFGVYATNPPVFRWRGRCTKQTLLDPPGLELAPGQRVAVAVRFRLVGEGAFLIGGERIRYSTERGRWQQLIPIRVRGRVKPAPSRPRSLGDPHQTNCLDVSELLAGHRV